MYQQYIIGYYRDQLGNKINIYSCNKDFINFRINIKHYYGLDINFKTNAILYCENDKLKFCSIHRLISRNLTIVLYGRIEIPDNSVSIQILSFNANRENTNTSNFLLKKYLNVQTSVNYGNKI